MKNTDKHTHKHIPELDEICRVFLKTVKTAQMSISP